MDKKRIYFYANVHAIAGTFCTFMLYMIIITGWDSCLWPTWLEYLTVPISFGLLLLMAYTIVNLIKNRKVSDKIFSGTVMKTYQKEYNMKAPFDINKRYALLQVGSKRTKAICPWELEIGTDCAFCKSGKQYVIIGVIAEEAQANEQTETNNNT